MARNNNKRTSTTSTTNPAAVTSADQSSIQHVLVPTPVEVINRAPATTGNFNSSNVGLKMDLSVEDITRTAVSKAKRAANANIATAQTNVRNITNRIQEFQRQLNQLAQVLINDAAEPRRLPIINAVMAFVGQPSPVGGSVSNKPHGVTWTVTAESVGVGTLPVETFQVSGDVQVGSANGTLSTTIVIDVDSRSAGNPLSVYNGIVSLNIELRAAQEVLNEARRALEYVELQLGDAVRDDITARFLQRAAANNPELDVFSANVAALLMGTPAENLARALPPGGI